MKTNGLPIPDPIDPEKALEFCMRIPDAPEYSQAFWGAMHNLGRWFSWEKDGTDRAKIAAETFWSYVGPAYNKYLSGCVECTSDIWRLETMPIRPHPTETGIVQASTDCENWYTWLDLRSWFGLLGSGDFEESETEGETEQEAANHLVQWFQTFVTEIDIRINAGQTINQITIGMAQWPPLQGTSNTTDPLKDLITDMVNKTAQERTDELGADWWEELWDLIACAMDTTGTVLNAAQDAIVDFLNTSSSWLANSLEATAEAMGYAGMNGGASFNKASGGGGAGFGNASCYYDPIAIETGGYAVGQWQQYDLTGDLFPAPSTYEEICIGGVAGYTIIGYEIHCTYATGGSIGTSQQNGGIDPVCYIPGEGRIPSGAFSDGQRFQYCHGAHASAVFALWQELELGDDTIDVYWDVNLADGAGSAGFVSVSGTNPITQAGLRIKPIFKVN